MKPDATFTRAQGLLVGCLLLPIIAVFYHLGQLNRGLLVASVLGAAIIVVVIKRNELKRVVVLATIIVIFAPQMVAIFLYNEEVGRIYGASIIPIFWGDVSFALIATNVLSRLFEHTK